MKKVEFKVVKLKDGAEFKWRETMDFFLNSSEWSKANPLVTVSDVERGVKIAGIMKSEEEVMIIEDNESKYLCSLVESMPVKPGASADFLEKFLEFKKYFAEVDKAPSKTSEELKAEE